MVGLFVVRERVATGRVIGVCNPAPGQTYHKSGPILTGGLAFPATARLRGHRRRRIEMLAHADIIDAGYGSMPQIMDEVRAGRLDVCAIAAIVARTRVLIRDHSPLVMDPNVDVIMSWASFVGSINR